MEGGELGFLDKKEGRFKQEENLWKEKGGRGKTTISTIIR